MKKHLFYATRDGQSRLIAARMADRMAGRGLTINPQNLMTDFPSLDELKGSGLIIVIASIRYGFHLPEATKLLKLYKKMGSACPLVVVSINLTARKPGKDTKEGNIYLRKWLERNKINPAIAMPIAGKVDYPRYNWFDKNMIRLIMSITRGPTDPTKSVEYTQWDRVDDLADRIISMSQNS
ncbi:MAG: menaquinone-dependent protoporphyrinogen IX dehydrogenase [Alphaproteobacteria bacterium]|nr:menaquinone-dependent protoporphyrinogen IX dehydrogenase [Alphaproteobacteria bacterium]